MDIVNKTLKDQTKAVAVLLAGKWTDAAQEAEIKLSTLYFLPLYSLWLSIGE